MTRLELSRELQKLENYIEVAQLLISKPLCNCLGNIQDKFKARNLAQLHDLKQKQNILTALQHESDEALSKIVYTPPKIHIS